MTTWGVNHCALDVWRGQTVKVSVGVQGGEILKEGFEVLVGVLDILHPTHTVIDQCLQA